MGTSETLRDRIKVVVVDDHAMIRELLTGALATVSNFHVVGDAADAEAGIALCEKLQPHVVILDSVLPGLQGSAAVEEIIKVSPRTGILMVSGSFSPASIHRALQSGASGYISKYASVLELIEGIRAIHAGRVFFGTKHQHLVRGILAQVDRQKPGLMLSSRESSILACIAQGKSSKEIAAQIWLSVFTIENHRRRVMQKTGLRSVAQLTLLAMELGLIAPVKALDVSRLSFADAQAE
jgi:DNA-binding NarL/FixJ family response regulator